MVSEDANESGVLLIEPESAGYTFLRKIYMGVTRMSTFDLERAVQSLEQNFTCGRYNIFSWNCNHFSNEFLKLLVDK